MVCCQTYRGGQQPDQEGEARRLRVHQLPELPDPVTALRREAQLESARNDQTGSHPENRQTPLISEEPPTVKIETLLWFIEGLDPATFPGTPPFDLSAGYVANEQSYRYRGRQNNCSVRALNISGPNACRTKIDNYDHEAGHPNHPR